MIFYVYPLLRCIFMRCIKHFYYFLPVFAVFSAWVADATLKSGSFCYQSVIWLFITFFTRWTVFSVWVAFSNCFYFRFLSDFIIFYPSLRCFQFELRLATALFQSFIWLHYFLPDGRCFQFELSLTTDLFQSFYLNSLFSTRLCGVFSLSCRWQLISV